MVNVVVVDEFPVVREGIKAVLSSEPDLWVVGDASTSDEVLDHSSSAQPDVVVLGIRRTEPESVEAARVLLERYPELKVLVLTSFPCASVLQAIEQMGAAGIVIKESDRQVLRDAVRAIGAGSTYRDETVEVFADSLRSPTGRPQGLTPRELEVLELLPEGLSNRAIAKALSISAEAVKKRLSSAMAKLGIRDRAQASAWVLRSENRADGDGPTPHRVRSGQDLVNSDEKVPEIVTTASG